MSAHDVGFQLTLSCFFYPHRLLVQSCISPVELPEYALVKVYCDIQLPVCKCVQEAHCDLCSCSRNMSTHVCVFSVTGKHSINHSDGVPASLSISPRSLMTQHSLFPLPSVRPALIRIHDKMDPGKRPVPFIILQEIYCY